MIKLMAHRICLSKETKSSERKHGCQRYSGIMTGQLQVVLAVTSWKHPAIKELRNVKFPMSNDKWRNSIYLKRFKGDRVGIIVIEFIET